MYTHSYYQVMSLFVNNINRSKYIFGKEQDMTKNIIFNCKFGVNFQSKFSKEIVLFTKNYPQVLKKCNKIEY